MGIFDIFKKKTIEPEIRDVGLEEAEKLLRTRGENSHEVLITLRKEITAKIDLFIQELEKQISTLSTIDLSDKKEDGRLKRLTLQGLEEYTEQLRRLIKQLQRIDMNQPIHHCINEIDAALNTFLRNSFKKYHRATILIGKELSEIDSVIKAFHKEIHELAEKNETHITNTRGLEQFDTHKKSVETITSSLEAVDSVLQSLREKHEITKNLAREHEKNFLEAQKGESYTTMVQEKKQLNNELLDISKEIMGLKNKLDLKTISKRVHGYTKHRDLVAKYRDNFTTALEEDTNLEFIEALNEEEQGLVADALRNLRKRKQELQKKEAALDPESIIRPHETKLRDTQTDAQELLDHITTEEKKRAKLTTEHTDTKNKQEEILRVALKDVKIID